MPLSVPRTEDERAPGKATPAPSSASPYLASRSCLVAAESERGVSGRRGRRRRGAKPEQRREKPGGSRWSSPGRPRPAPPRASAGLGRPAGHRADEQPQGRLGLGSLRGTLLRTSFALPGSGSNQQAESRLRIQGKGRAGARYGHGSDPPSPSLTRRRAALSTWNAACPADLRREGPLPCREVRGTRGRHGSRVGLPALSKAHPSPLRPQGRHLLPSHPQFKGK